MGEIQRYRLKRKGPREITPDPDGFVVRFPDHERIVADKDARIKELEGILSGKTMFDAVKIERERIRVEISRIRAEVSSAFDYPQASELALDSLLSVIDKEGNNE